MENKFKIAYLFSRNTLEDIYKEIENVYKLAWRLVNSHVSPKTIVFLVKAIIQYGLWLIHPKLVMFTQRRNENKLSEIVLNNSLFSFKFKFGKKVINKQS